MKKGYKVKRFSKSLYKAPKSKFRKIAEAVVSVAVVMGLGFVGFTAADTLANLRCDDCERHRLLCLCETQVFSPVESEPEPTTSPLEPPTVIEPPTEETAFTDLSGAIEAPANVLSNSAALLAFIAGAKADGFETVIIDMKDDVGHLLYQSSIVLSESMGGTLLSDNRNIVTGTLSAQSIASAISDSGLNPVARVATLRGRVAPENLPNVSYAGWIDGERAWANPQLSGTRTYISEIVRELHEAGFAGIILTGTTFPTKPFSARDLQILPAYVSDFESRFHELVAFVNFVADFASDANIFLEGKENDEVFRGEDGVFAENVILRKNFLQTIDN